MRVAVLALCFGLVSGAAFAQPAVPATPAPDVAAGPTAAIETSMGTITLALDKAHAPVTVDNFIRYAREGHFDGTMIYRVEPGFVIQMGSYTPDGGARSTHDPIPLEANNGQSNTRGAVAMARTDPNTATAEFFIDLSDNSASLDHAASDQGNNTGYAVFAHVTGGMDVVDKIAAVALGGSGPFPPTSTPATPVIIQKVAVSP